MARWCKSLPGSKVSALSLHPSEPTANVRPWAAPPRAPASGQGASIEHLGTATHLAGSWEPLRLGEEVGEREQDEDGHVGEEEDLVPETCNDELVGVTHGLMPRLCLRPEATHLAFPTPFCG